MKMVRPLAAVTAGLAKDVPNAFFPASSRKGSTLAKLKWLNALLSVIRISKLLRSPSLIPLITEKLARLEGASDSALRGELPNGVPNTCWAKRELTIKRTWFGATVVIVGVALCNAFRLSSVVGAMFAVLQMAGVLVWPAAGTAPRKAMQ